MSGKITYQKKNGKIYSPEYQQWYKESIYTK